MNIGAVLLGVAAGALSASVVALLFSGLLVLVGVESGAEIGLVVGILLGLTVGGWVAGSRARHSSRFHGAITGMVLAAVVIVIAVLGGSPASTRSILWLALLSAVVAGAAGWLAGRRDEPES